MGEYERQDGNKGRKWGIIMAAAVAVAVAAVIVSLVLTVDFFGKETEAETKMEDLRVEVERTNPPPEPNDGDSGKMPDSAREGTPAPEPLPRNPYADLFVENEDMAAWLAVAGTVIDYPVMQTMEDENYYLYRDFHGNEDKAGCLILDTDSSLYDVEGTANLIIHGHNMKAGTMFGELDAYKDENYYQEHKHMTLYTRMEKREYEVIAVFYSQVYYSTDKVFKYYDFFQAGDESKFSEFYTNIKEMSLYDTGMEAELGDQFLTLSTCTYHVEDGRFVVVAKETDREDRYEAP